MGVIMGCQGALLHCGDVGGRELGLCSVIGGDYEVRGDIALLLGGLRAGMGNLMKTFGGLAAQLVLGRHGF